MFLLNGTKLSGSYRSSHSEVICRASVMKRFVSELFSRKTHAIESMKQPARIQIPVYVRYS